MRSVFKNLALLASLTVEENIAFFRGRALTPGQVIRDCVNACLEGVGIYDVAHFYFYAGELRGRLQSRVSFS